MTYANVLTVLHATLAQTGTDAAAAAPVEAPQSGIMATFLAISNAIVDGWLAFLDWFGALFAPVMKPLFAPLNNLMASVYQPWAQIFALGLFIGAMVWVCFFMSRDMLESGRENKAFWTDLRLWTVLSMLPHLFVYIYFM